MVPNQLIHPTCTPRPLPPPQHQHNNTAHHALQAKTGMDLDLTVAKLANTQELTLLKTNQHSLLRYMISVNAPPTTTPGALPPREKPTNPTQQGGKHNLNKTTHIPQTTDNQQPQDNGTMSAKRSDGKTTPGTPCGYARHVLPRRILLRLPQKRGKTN